MREPTEDRPVWIDGERGRLAEARLSLNDDAILAGMGLFETLSVRGGKARDLEPHLSRLAEGAARLGAPMPDPLRLAETVTHAAAAERADHGWLKIVLARGGRWFVFTGGLDQGYEGREFSAVLLPWRRSLHDPLCGLKSLNYAANRLGLEEARRRGADEGLWLNSRGHLAEGCASNLFVVRGGSLFTPAPGEGILPGVVRGVAIGEARRQGRAVHEGKLRLKRLLQAGEAFMTSSLGGVLPLVRFEERPVGSGKPGPITRSIAAGVAAIRAGG